MFNGWKPAVIAIIVVALYKVAKKALHGPLHWTVAAIAFCCVFFYNIPLPLILLGTIVLALLIRWIRPASPADGRRDNLEELADENEYYLNKYTVVATARSGAGQLLKVTGIFVLCWLIPILIFYLFFPGFVFWKQLTLFFTQTAFFTIGGSYTVLPYVAQFAVAKLNWLNKMQMVDGFALAETTPGPLIIVVGFVGFMAGYNNFHASLTMGILALLLTVYYTFLPCFLFVFIGAPWIAKSGENPLVRSVLKFVTAAVVAAILQLTVFLVRGGLFPAGSRSPDLW